MRTLRVLSGFDNSQVVPAAPTTSAQSRHSTSYGIPWLPPVDILISASNRRGHAILSTTSSSSTCGHDTTTKEGRPNRCQSGYGSVPVIRPTSKLITVP
jgi:hypothetical protein